MVPPSAEVIVVVPVIRSGRPAAGRVPVRVGPTAVIVEVHRFRPVAVVRNRHRRDPRPTASQATSRDERRDEKEPTVHEPPPCRTIMIFSTEIVKMGKSSATHFAVVAALGLLTSDYGDSPTFRLKHWRRSPASAAARARAGLNTHAQAGQGLPLRRIVDAPHSRHQINR